MKNYKILAFRNVNGTPVKLQQNNLYVSETATNLRRIGDVIQGELTVEHCLDHPELKIDSIKRTKSGEVFTVGETYNLKTSAGISEEYYQIASIEFINGHFYFSNPDTGIKTIAKYAVAPKSFIEKNRKEMEAQFEKDLFNSQMLGTPVACEVDVLDSSFAKGTKRKFESGSRRDSDDNKPLPLEFNPYMLMRYGFHMKMGQLNYGDGNWDLGQPDLEVWRSLSRHMMQAYANFRFPETAKQTDDGSDHLSAIIFGINMLMHNEAKAGVPADKYFKGKKDEGQG